MTQRVLITAGATGSSWPSHEHSSPTGAEVHIADVDESALESATAEHEKPEWLGHRRRRCRGPGPVVRRRSAHSRRPRRAGQRCRHRRPDGAGQRVRPRGLRRRCPGQPPGDVPRHPAGRPPLVESGSGSIITMSSLAGRFSYPNRIAYSTNNWGLLGFAKTLAIELGPCDAPGAPARVLGRASAPRPRGATGPGRRVR